MIAVPLGKNYQDSFLLTKIKVYFDTATKRPKTKRLKPQNVLIRRHPKTKILTTKHPRYKMSQTKNPKYRMFPGYEISQATNVPTTKRTMHKMLKLKNIPNYK
jgi:hypothetical protein